jgi:nitroreductase
MLPSSTRYALALSDAHHNDESPSLQFAVDLAIDQRYACTRFQRYDGILNSTNELTATATATATLSNQTVVTMAIQALDIARRAPSGFNAQPYKMVVVSSPDQKLAVARHCSGRNAYRVRDSDCTIVFLADKETGKNFGAYQRLLETKNPAWKDKRWAMIKLKCILALFSSGYPLLPRLLSVPISFFVRLGVSVANLLIGRWIVVPTLSSAETWASKNTMLVAMAYMLGCSARGIATCPMEGIHGGGIRAALNIPRRYSIPLIVATGNAYQRPTDTSHDDVGMDHGRPGTRAATPRYDRDEMIFGDVFGKAIP